MQRKPLFLVAAVAELARFFALAIIAGAVGALGASNLPAGGSGLALFYRYATAPQLLFVVAFFFLWYDPERYSPFRPLIIVGKALSILNFLPFMFYVVTSIYDLPIAGSSAPVAAVLAAVVDVAGLLVACLASRTREKEGTIAEAKEATKPPAGTGGEAKAASMNGPRDPSEIEEVEG